MRPRSFLEIPVGLGGGEENCGLANSCLLPSSEECDEGSQEQGDDRCGQGQRRQGRGGIGAGPSTCHAAVN